SESFLLSLQLQNIFVAAELEAGQYKPYVMNVQINHLITSALENFKHLIARKKLGVRFTSNLGNEAVFPTDPEKLNVILSNLLMNAVEYTPPKGEVSVTILKQKDGYLSISIQDSG